MSLWECLRYMKYQVSSGSDNSALLYDFILRKQLSCVLFLIKIE